MSEVKTANSSSHHDNLTGKQVDLETGSISSASEADSHSLEASPTLAEDQYLDFTSASLSRPNFGPKITIDVRGIPNTSTPVEDFVLSPERFRELRWIAVETAQNAFAQAAEDLGIPAKNLENPRAIPIEQRLSLEVRAYQIVGGQAPQVSQELTMLRFLGHEVQGLPYHVNISSSSHSGQGSPYRQGLDSLNSSQVSRLELAPRLSIDVLSESRLEPDHVADYLQRLRDGRRQTTPSGRVSAAEIQELRANIQRADQSIPGQKVQAFFNEGYLSASARSEAVRQAQAILVEISPDFARGAKPSFSEVDILSLEGRL